MALHKDFPKDPYAILDPNIRWFPADEDLREKGAIQKLLPPLVAGLREKVMMFVCPTCKVADGVCYDTKGDSLDEDIYSCSKCGFYFVVSASCKKCNGVHSRSYGCSSIDCKCVNYHYNHEEKEIEV